jgi:hypothetical protein
VPKPIILRLLVSTKNSLSALSHPEQELSQELTEIGQEASLVAQAILRSSTAGVAITLSLDMESFRALFSGANLRLETLELLYTIAAN